FGFLSLVVVVAVVLMLINHRRLKHADEAIPFRMRPLAAAWVVLALGAIVPYVFTARIPDLFNQESRHLLLVGFPSAVLVLAVLRMRPGGKWARRIREWAALALIVLGV